MADLSPRPERAATREERVAELHRLADEDYASTANLRQPLNSAADAVRDQLHDPNRPLPTPADLDLEIAVTHRILDEMAGLNTGDLRDMQRAAGALNLRLRSLLSAIEAERGGRR